MFLYAEALLDHDTPKSIELTRTIVATDPGFARAHLLLADIYSYGNFADRQKARQELETFFAVCPATLDHQALGLAQSYGGSELAAKITPQLRNRLATETDPEQLKDWETVWNLEFKAHPVHEHDQVRQQISADLERMHTAIKNRMRAG